MNTAAFSKLSDEVNVDISTLNYQSESAELQRKEGKIKNWSSLSSSRSKLHFHRPVSSYVKKKVCIPKTIHDRGSVMWKNCLIGQFLGASPHISQIVRTVSKIWGRRCKIYVIPFGCYSFLFKFEDAQTKR